MSLPETDSSRQDTRDEGPQVALELERCAGPHSKSTALMSELEQARLRHAEDQTRVSELKAALEENIREELAKRSSLLDELSQTKAEMLKLTQAALCYLRDRTSISAWPRSPPSSIVIRRGYKLDQGPGQGKLAPRPGRRDRGASGYRKAEHLSVSWDAS